MRKKILWWLTFALVSVGLLLWGVNWWANRPLFLDEANVVRNLYDRSFTSLFLPLDHRQYAPPLYLLLAKACGVLFGFTERSLRLPALLGGALAVYGLFVGSKALQLKWWTLLPLALLFANPTVLRYVGEVKPYGLDLGIAALLLGFGLKSFQPNWRWAVGGAIAIWCSLPAVFVLATLGSYHLRKDSRRLFQKKGQGLMPWILLGATWLTAFGLLYFTVLAPSMGSTYLNVFHGPYFFPLPGDDNFWSVASGLTLGFPKLAFGYTVVAIAVGALVALGAILRSRRGAALWLLLPIIFVTGASLFGFFSLIPRLLLFTLPGWWLLAGQLSHQLSKKLPPFATPLIVGLWLVILGGTNVLRHFSTPERFSDARALVWELDPGYQPVLHHGAVPTFDYYHRIHPKGPKADTTLKESNISEATLPGKYVLVYDVLTQGNIRVSAQQDSVWATERGCEVRVAPYFRAKAIYVDCK